MIIHKIIHPFSTHICDGDILSENNFLLIDEKNNIYRNGIKINIKMDLEFPIIRIISDDHFILVDGDSNKKKDNAWIIHNNGTIENAFYIGNAFNIILTESNIIAAYSECSLNTERIFKHTANPSEKDVSSEGLAVFDLQGSCLFKYMSDAKEENIIPFISIYSFLRKDEDNIYLLAYLFTRDIAILEFNLNSYSIKHILNIPEAFDCNLPRAMTKKNDDWYFLTTNPNHTEIEQGNLNSLKSYLFKLDKMLFVEKIGECCFSNKMHGNDDGSFSVPLSIKNQYQNSCFIKI